MLMFREEKSPEDEIKAWQFWHSRQHSVKQRILDAGKWMVDEMRGNYQRFTTSRFEQRRKKLLMTGRKCHNFYELFRYVSLSCKSESREKEEKLFTQI